MTEGWQFNLNKIFINNCVIIKFGRPIMNMVSFAIYIFIDNTQDFFKTAPKIQKKLCYVNLKKEAKRGVEYQPINSVCAFRKDTHFTS
jgi:hypothetical protein